MLGLVSVLLVPLTLNRLDTFSSAIKLWDDAEKLVRDKAGVSGIERIYTNRGNKLFQLKRYDEAIADFSTNGSWIRTVDHSVRNMIHGNNRANPSNPCLPRFSNSQTATQK